MNGKSIYKIWAPTGAKWVDWVRPVPFVEINNNFKSYMTSKLILPNIENFSKDMAIIVDLPGMESIQFGLALANVGFRPIPVFNGTIEQENSIPTTDNKTIITGLIYGASKLKDINISNDAPPAFLVDTNRMNRLKMNSSVFDNSWDLYHQDLPTAEYFLKNDINKITIISRSVQKDLRKIFYKFQKKGIQFFLSNGFNEPKKISIRKPLGKDTD